MLSQIVQPMVSAQIRLLAKSKTTKITLSETIAKWLRFLGVEAQVTQLKTIGDQIQVSIIIGQPENSEDGDWQRNLDSLGQDTEETAEPSIEHSSLIPADREIEC